MSIFSLREQISFVLGVAVFTLLVFSHGAALGADGRTRERPWFFGVFGGVGLSNSFSEIVLNPFGASRTNDDVAVVTVGREFARAFDNDLSFEVEAMYAYHFNRQEYHEVSATVYARWHLFPWNSWLTTTLAFGVGPRYVTDYPKMETEKGFYSRVLNQANVEITAALPEYPEHQLVLRLQHRSGIFGLIDGVRDGSDFVTLGYKHYF
jgi:hypothetical protein